MDSPDKSDISHEEPKPWSQQFGPFLTLGIQLALTVGASTFIGWLLDGWLGTAPWCMVGGVVLGATGGIISFSKTVMRLGREQDEQAEKARRKKEHHEV